jgi:hypothetical protein
MRKIAFAIAASAAFLIGPPLQAREKLTPEQRLEKLLEGREAGKPVSCLSTWSSRNMRVLDNTALIYDAGSVIYVNRPANPDVLEDNDVLAARQTGSLLCRLDRVSMHDRSGNYYRGFVSLNDFVPYRLIAKAD